MKARGEPFTRELEGRDLEQFGSLAFAEFGGERFEVAVRRALEALEPEELFNVWRRVWHGGYRFQNSPR
jgi:hypothetical protein